MAFTPFADEPAGGFVPFDMDAPDAPVKTVASDYVKSVASGALSGAGAIAQGGGELLARGVNAAVPDANLRAVNPLQGAIDWLEQSKSPGAKALQSDAEITGDWLHPSTWDFGKNPTLRGIALQGLNAVGQLAPNLAQVLATAGTSIPAQLAIGATVGGVQAFGGSLDQERERIGRMTPEELSESSELYRTLIDKGSTPDQAKAAVGEAAAIGGGIGNAIPSAAEGAFESLLVGALTRGRLTIAGKGLLGKVATGVAGGAALGGVEEAVEQTSQNLGSNIAIGGNRPLGEDTLQQFVMGAIGQGAPGAGFAAAQHVASSSNKKIFESGSTDEAVAQFNASVSGTDVDTNAALAEAVAARKQVAAEDATRTAVAQQDLEQAQINRALGHGDVVQDEAGDYHVNEGDYSAPLRVWDGETPSTTGNTIPSELVTAQQEHYGTLGFRVVYYEDNALLPDGVFDRTQPDTLFLSNDPQRNAVQVAAHEVKHGLESQVLPDGKTAGELLNETIREGITDAGWRHAIETFTSTAPEMPAEGAGQLKQRAWAERWQQHMLSELGADIGGEASKFETFMPKVVARIEAKYGTPAAQSFLSKFIESIKSAYETLKKFFGDAPTVSQTWVSNLEEVHSVLADMYARAYGTQYESRQAAKNAEAKVAANKDLIEQAEKRAGRLEVVNEKRAKGELLTSDEILIEKLGPVKAPEGASPALKTAIAAVQKPGFLRDKIDERNIADVKDGIVMSPKTREKAKLAAMRTRTPEFKSWFRDSKVVNDRGEPLVVYHGTGQDFDKPKGRFWASDTPSVAGTFAENSDGASSIIPAHLVIRNPLVVDADGLERNDIRFRGAKRDTDYIADVALEEGHDGVIVRNVFDSFDGSAGLATSYAVFNPSQVKSVFNAKPTTQVSLSHSPKQDAKKIEAARAVNTGVHVNIGLDVGDQKNAVSRTSAVSALKLAGVKVLSSAVHKSDTESTLVARIDRALTPDEAHAVSQNLRQEAIAQVDKGRGELYGPKADAWRPFNPEYFWTLDGKRLSEVQPEKRAPAAKAPRLPSPRAVAKLMQSLTPAEQDRVTNKWVAKIIALLKKLPHADEVAAVAFAGRAKRGWYAKSAQAISDIFGPDAPHFAALLAAMSPQTGVEDNLFNTLNVWRGWIKAGRPKDRESIVRIMGENVQGDKGQGSVLGAWVNNADRALSYEDLSQITFSGPKVNSFYLNLLGNVTEVTNDTWMANYAGVEQKIFAGHERTKGTISGKGVGYLAMNARVREGAARLTELTGDTWSPAEVQETIWSWVKTIYEKANFAGETRNARQLVMDDAVTQEMIASTPDFGTMFTDPEYRAILEEAGYGDELRQLESTQRDNERQPGEDDGVEREASPFDRDTQKRHEFAAARRLDRLAARSRAESGGAERTGSDGREDGAATSFSPKPGQLDLTGVHFSKEPRTFLSGAFYGTGMKGEEARRVLAAKDKRLRSRVYAYVNQGKGVRPESYVGAQAHTVRMENLYDADADPLALYTVDLNKFESAVLDAGYDGYFAREDNQGIAVLIGEKARVAAEPKGFDYRGEDLEVPPAPTYTAGKQLALAIANSKLLPSGEMSGADWKVDLVRLTPELATPEVLGRLQDDIRYYKSDIGRLANDNSGSVSVQLSPKGFQNLYRQKVSELEAAKREGDTRLIQRITQEPLPVSETPAALQEMQRKDGSKPLKRSKYILGTVSTVIQKGRNEHANSDHGVAIPHDILERLPALLADPLAVFDRRSKAAVAGEYNNSVLVFTREKVAGKYVAVAIKPDDKYGSEQVNSILSVHPRTAGQMELYRAEGSELKPSGYLQNKTAEADLGSIPGASTAGGNVPEADGGVKLSPKIVGDSKRQYTAAQRQMFQNTGRTIDEKSFGQKIADLRKDLGKKLAQGLVDQFAPIKELSPMAYMLARLSKGSAGAFEALLRHGKLRLRGGAYDADQSGGFVDRVGIPLHGELEDFLWWVAANRADRLSKEDREHLFSPADIAAGKSLANGSTSFDYKTRSGATTRSRNLIYVDALKSFDEFNKNTLDMAEQSGLINSESRKLWEHEFYVPFYRVSDEDGSFIGGKMANALVRQRAFKHLKGGTQKLNSDLLANTLANWAHLIDASAKNRAAKSALEAAAQMGVAVEADKATVAAMAGSIGKKGSTVWFMDGGTQRHFLVDDPYVMTAIASLEYAGMRGPLMDALSTMKHVLTVGVTASPAFKVRNLIRDSLQAIGTAPIGYNPLGNIREGFAASEHSTQTYVSALASGGLIRFGTMLEGRMSDRVRQLVKAGIKDTTILDSDAKFQAMYDRLIEPAVAAYNELGNRSEEITRTALYKQLTDKGMDHAQASLMARDLMDFSMQGSWTGIRFLTQVVPFMNARMQGLYKLGRGAKEDPKRFAAVLGATALFSIALLAAYGDDDDWKKREDWDRDNFWWFKMGGTAFRIPKPFEIGAIATLAERGIEYFSDPEMTGERLNSRVLSLLANNLSMNPVPQLVKPIVDVYANQDSFTGRPIESMGMERLQPDYRFTSRSSMAARAASTAGQAVTSAAGVDFLSPVQIDHMLRGYFGWLGSFVVGASEVATRPASGQPTRPAGDTWRFATQGFVSELPADQSRYVSQMYEQAKVIEQAYGTYQQLLKQGKPVEAKEFLDDNRDKLMKYKSIEAVKRAESKFNERIRIIERSALDPDAKKTAIAAIAREKDRVARMVK